MTILRIRRALATLAARDLDDRRRQRLDELVALAVNLPAIQAAIDVHDPGPQAQAYDRTGGGTLVWCDRHERALAVCHRREILCEGVPVPRFVDPTGDAATGPDTAHTQRAQLERVATALETAARQDPVPLRLLDVAARDLHGLDQWRRPMDPKRAKKISDETAIGVNVWCQSHQRLGILEPRDQRRTGRTDVAGRLKEPVILCRSCVERITAEARPDDRMTLKALVPIEDLEYHHQHGRWRPVRVGI